jgi:hypothetical protein
MKIPKKIGLMIWKERYKIYFFYCMDCSRAKKQDEFWRGWGSSERVTAWYIREGQLGNFRQNCDNCEKEINTLSSLSMPSLFPETSYDRVLLGIDGGMTGPEQYGYVEEGRGFREYLYDPSGSF